MRVNLDFSGMDRLMRNIESLGGNVDEAAQKALEKTHAYVTGEIESAMKTHKVNGKPVNWDHTGDTVKSLRKEAEVDKAGHILEVKTGFEWPTAAHYVAFGRGTPRKMEVSPQLGRALSKKKMAPKVKEIQEEALQDYISETMSK